MEQLHDRDPKSIGPYRVVGLLGSGGMGRVFLCTSPGGRRVAVKVIRPELADDAEFRSRFRREVATAKLVRSHVIAAVVDADTEAPSPWLATIFLDGPTLSAAVEQAPWAEPELRRLAAALAEALQFIHGAGLIHRDLKPSNIILAPDGPRVIDFGIARAADATALTTTSMRIGSPGYMAPEQIRADATGPESDVFALGAVLFYAATGRSPFGSGPTDIVLYRVLHEEPDLEDVPPGVRSLVAACLAKDPRKRPTPDVILQETTGDPAPLLPTRAFAREHASAQVVSGPTSTIGAAATVLRADVSVQPQRLPALTSANPDARPSVEMVKRGAVHSDMLIRAGGIAAILGGLLMAANEVWYDRIPGRQYGAMVSAQHSTWYILMFVALLGLAALQRPTFGRLGRIATAVALVGVGGMAITQLIDTLAYLRSSDPMAGTPTVMQDIEAVVVLVGFFAGLLLFAVATFRARVLPRPAAVLLIVALPLWLYGGFSDVTTGGLALVGVSFAWMGVAGLRSRSRRVKSGSASVAQSNSAATGS